MKCIGCGAVMIFPALAPYCAVCRTRKEFPVRQGDEPRELRFAAVPIATEDPQGPTKLQLMWRYAHEGLKPLRPRLATPQIEFDEATGILTIYH